MNKKILIGSIIAVVLLIGVSFTSVVGYNSVTSDMKESPLFTVRSSRAIDEESKGLTCDYIGKGEEISMQLPTRDKKIITIKKTIDRISKMDDEAINRLIGLVSKYQHKNNDEVNDKETLQFIRDNPNELKNLAKSELTLFYIAPSLRTMDGPGCFINLLLEIIWIIWLIVEEILWIVSLHPASTLCTLASPLCD